MKIFERFDTSVAARVMISAGLACVALLLFVMSNRMITSSGGLEEAFPSLAKGEVSAAMAKTIDNEVDSVLARFGIDRTWIKKKSVPLSNSSVNRVERQVMIPPDVIPVQMNHALSLMAQRFSGKAVATENRKENSVTIHIEMQGYVIQSIILKPNASLRRSETASKSARV